METLSVLKALKRHYLFVRHAPVIYTESYMFTIQEIEHSHIQHMDVGRSEGHLF